MFGLTNEWCVIISCCVLLISVWRKCCPEGGGGGDWGHSSIPFDVNDVQHCELIYQLMFTFTRNTGAEASKQWEGSKIIALKELRETFIFYFEKVALT